LGPGVELADAALIERRDRDEVVEAFGGEGGVSAEEDEFAKDVRRVELHEVEERFIGEVFDHISATANFFPTVDHGKGLHSFEVKIEMENLPNYLLVGGIDFFWWVVLD
jgi:hypothetical protein